MPSIGGAASPSLASEKLCAVRDSEGDLKVTFQLLGESVAAVQDEITSTVEEQQTPKRRKLLRARGGRSNKGSSSTENEKWMGNTLLPPELQPQAVRNATESVDSHSGVFGNSLLGVHLWVCMCGTRW